MYENFKKTIKDFFELEDILQLIISETMKSNIKLDHISSFNERGVSVYVFDENLTYEENLKNSILIFIGFDDVEKLIKGLAI